MFAGKYFRDLITPKFEQALEIIKENQNHLTNLKGVVYTGGAKGSNTINKSQQSDIPFIVTSGPIGSAPHMHEEIKKIIPNIDNYEIVMGIAGDSYSWVLNDNNNWKSTIEGAMGQIKRINNRMKNIINYYKSRIVQCKSAVTLVD